MSLDHEARRHRIGASEVAAILGENPNMTPLDVWMVKTGQAAPFEGNEHTRRGQRQERQILEWLAEELGRRIAISCPSVNHSGGLASATPDGIVLGSVKDDFLWEFERFEQPIEEFLAETFEFPYELAEAKSTLKTIRSEEDIPVTWIIQCQWQMMCTGLKRAHLAIFGPMVSDYQRFEITYNEAFAAELLAQAQEWWDVHIVGGKMPEPINSNDAALLWPIDDGSSIEAVPSLAKAIAEYSALKARERDIKAACLPFRDRITLAIGTAKTVRHNGRTIATFAADKNGNRSLRTF